MNSGCLFQQRHPYRRKGAIIRKASAFSQLASILYFLCSWWQTGWSTKRGTERGKGIWKYLVTEEIILFITQPWIHSKRHSTMWQHLKLSLWRVSAETPPPCAPGRCYRSIWSSTSRLTHSFLPTAVPLQSPHMDPSTPLYELVNSLTPAPQSSEALGSVYSDVQHSDPVLTEGTETGGCGCVSAWAGADNLYTGSLQLNRTRKMHFGGGWSDWEITGLSFKMLDIRERGLW